MATVLTTRHSIKQTTEKSFGNALKLHKEESRLRQLEMLEALYTEAKQNLSMVTSQQNNFKFRLTTDAWDLYKQGITTLPAHKQDQFLGTYAEISKHNSLIDYDLRVPHGHGSKDAQVQQQGQRVQEKLRDLIDDYESQK